MYPTISDFLKDILGVYLPLPIQTFGFFMALGFVFAAYTLQLELKRKEKEGLLKPIYKKILKGAPFKKNVYITSSIIGLIIGYKLIGAFTDYNSFAENPQTYILSLNGSFVGGLIGIVSGYYNTYRNDKKQRLEKPEYKEIEFHPYELTGNIVILAALFGLIGAKVFNSLENIDDFIADPIDSLISFSGLTFYGGLIFAAIAIIYYTNKKGISFKVLTDSAAPGLMLAYAIGRMGCHFSGDGDWGIVNTSPKPTIFSFLPDWFWSYRFPHNVINEGIKMEGCIGKHCYILPQPVYPTSLYEIIMGIIIFIILWSLRKKIRISGMLFFIYLTFNGIERFFIEKIRVNVKYHIFGHGITQAEIISSLLIITGIAGILYLIKDSFLPSNINKNNHS